MSQISRLRASEIANGNLINADDLGAEFDQQVAESNAQDTRLTALESGAITLTGVKTFVSAPKVNQFAERTAGAGLTITNLKLTPAVGFTPTTNGQIGYDSTAHSYDVFVNGAAQYLVHSGNISSLTGLSKGFISGRPPVYASAATITFPSGLRARSSDNTADIELAADVTVTLAGAWAVGAPGLDAGVEAANTWYYYYLIKRPDTGVTSVIASAVNEAATGTITLPANYTLKRQLPFAARNDASSNLRDFQVQGSWPPRPVIRWRGPGLVVTPGPTYTAGALTVLSNGTQTSYTALDLSAHIPPISRAVNLQITNNGNTYAVMQTDTATGNVMSISASGAAGTHSVQETYGFPTTATQTIEYKNNGLGIYIDVLGFVVTEGF